MPKGSVYKRTPKKKICWEVRQTPDGFLVINHTTGIPLCGYWSKREIAEKNGVLYYGCEPTPYAEGEPPTHAQTPETGVGGGAAGQVPVVDLPPPGARPERVVEAMDVSQREVPVESGPVALPEPAPERRVLSPQEARDLICSVFRAKRIQRPKQR